MNGLLPIIRRARRPLYPPEDAAPVVPPAVVELPPSVPPVESVLTAPADAPLVPPGEPKAKKGKRGGSPAP